MAKYVGTWVYDTAASLGDSVKLLRLDVRDNSGIGWGTSVGLGWTPTLQVRKPGTTTVVSTVTGAFETNATDPESAALFQIGTVGALVPVLATDPGIDYEGQLVMVDPGGLNVSVPGADGNAEFFAFRVERWP